MPAPKVSVIVPVYNTEAYVESAVRSIMEQTLRQIEILTIDDGSTDGSLALLAQLAAEDPRIRIHAQPNQGPSEARNTGIWHARGEYLYFMDSDDLLESDALELCCAKCDAEQLDLVIFDADTFGADTSDKPWFNYHRSAAYEDRVHEGPALFDAMLRHRKYIASPCLYIIRRDFMEKNQLSFYPGILHEDELFTTQALLCASRVGRIDRAFFKRRLRPNSIMGCHFSERNLRGYMTVFAEIRRFAAGRGTEALRLTGEYLRYALDPVLRNASELPAGVRIRTAGTIVAHYLRFIRPSALVALLAKAPIRKLLRR